MSGVVFIRLGRRTMEIWKSAFCDLSSRSIDDIPRYTGEVAVAFGLHYQIEHEWSANVQFFGQWLFDVDSN
ncbi:MAG: hypothetical protein CMF72_01110 [Mameliella sp.]|nr:hypothetical protein [Mameliella sp.]